MIVLDEHASQQSLIEAVGGWYQGKVISINSLRPGTVIKDDAIPALLRRVKQPTFVTINTPEFWHRELADPRYCIVCAALSADELHRIPALLRRLFRLEEFKTKAGRMGKVARVTHANVRYFQLHDPVEHVLPWTE
jgi:hypothetical protein